MKYYSAIKKNEILPLVKAWVSLEGIMLSEASQTKTNTKLFQLYVESKEQTKETSKIETDS